MREGKKRLIGKRGSIFDVLFAMIVLIVFAITIFISFKILADINDNKEPFSPEGQQILQSNTDNFPASYDSLFLILLIGFMTYTFISAFFIDTHPIFFVIAVIIHLTFIFLYGFFANVYDDFVSSAAFSGYVGTFPITHFVLSNALPIFIVYGFMVLFVLYKKAA